MPKLPDAVPRMSAWEEASGEDAHYGRMLCRAINISPMCPNDPNDPNGPNAQARTASKCSSRRSGRLGSRQNPELVKMRTELRTADVGALPVMKFMLQSSVAFWGVHREKEIISQGTSGGWRSFMSN